MILDFRLRWDVTHTPQRATPSPLLALFQSRGREWFPAGGGEGVAPHARPVAVGGLGVRRWVSPGGSAVRPGWRPPLPEMRAGRVRAPRRGGRCSGTDGAWG